MEERIGYLMKSMKRQKMTYVLILIVMEERIGYVRSHGKGRREAVLILIVMEERIGFIEDGTTQPGFHKVLILIVMEERIGYLANNPGQVFLAPCLNPNCNGRKNRIPGDSYLRRIVVS